MDILHHTRPPAIRPYVRALATSEGHHFTTVGASNDGAEFLALQEEHDRISHAYFKRADDELDCALEVRDHRLIHNHIRASMTLRAEGYRFEAMEDERRDQARQSLMEAHDAGVAGTETCESMLRQTGACGHGKAA